MKRFPSGAVVVTGAAQGIGHRLALTLVEEGVDVCVAECPGHRDSMVTILDEVEVADPIDVDRWHGLTASTSGRDPLPPAADAGRGRPELTVESAALPVDAANDRIQADRLKAEVSLAAAAEGGNYLLERQHRRDIVRLEPQTRRNPREGATPALAREVRLYVLLWRSSVRHSTRELVRGTRT